MTPARLKLGIIFAGLVLGVLALTAWTQPWFSLRLTDGTLIQVAGDAAAPALSALGLATLALFGALSIAGPFFRVVLGVLAVMIGALIITSGVTVLLDPLEAARSTFATVTGLAGAEAIRGLVAETTAAPWAIGSVVVGSLLSALGVATAATSRRWPASTRKYQAVGLEAADTEQSAVGDWDALSSGEDPTHGR